MKGMLKWLIVVVLVFTGTANAHADGTQQYLAELVKSYLNDLNGRTVEESVETLLERSKNGIFTRGSAEDILLREKLVVRGGQSAQLWIDLSSAWLAANRYSDSGLAAARRAADISAIPAKKMEALIIASEFLRFQLQAEHDRFEKQMDEIVVLHEYLNKHDQQVRTIDDDEVLLEGLRKQANAIGFNIESISNNLTKIYTEISDIVPGISLPKSNHKLRLNNIKYIESIDRFSTIKNVMERCFLFSDKLENGVMPLIVLEEVKEVDEVDEVDELEKYKSVSKYNLNIEGNSICISGLVSGLSYRISISKGLRSSVGKVLREKVIKEFEFAVLPKQVSFVNTEYVLPRLTYENIPVRLTNANSADFSLVRIRSRALSRNIVLGYIKNGLPAREAELMKSGLADLLWIGSAHWRSAAEKTNPFEFQFPIRSILQGRETWIRTHKNPECSKHLVDDLYISCVKEPPLSASSDLAVEISGTYRANATALDQAQVQPFAPGIYALMAQLSSENADTTSGEGEQEDVVEKNGDQEIATQWFTLTDLGISFYEGTLNFEVMVRSLQRGNASKNVTVQLVSQDNRVLYQGKTNTDGIVKFPVSLTRGTGTNKLVAIIAETDDDLSFIRFDSRRHDLSGLNVGAEETGVHEKVFLRTDRGIYEPGETVNILVFPRKTHSVAKQLFALKLEYQDGTVVFRKLPPDDVKKNSTLQKLKFDLPESLRAGAAQLALISSLGEILGETRINIGSVRADRARIIVTKEDGSSMLAVKRSLENFVTLTGTANVQYLFGKHGKAQAAGALLRTEITVQLKPRRRKVRLCGGWYNFGGLDDGSLAVTSHNSFNHTDENGVLELNIAGLKLPDLFSHVTAFVTMTVYDGSGPLASKTVALEIPSPQDMIGLGDTPHITQVNGVGYRVAYDFLSPSRQEIRLGDNLLLKLERDQTSYVLQYDGVSWKNKAVRIGEELVLSQRDLKEVPFPTEAEDCDGYKLSRLSFILPDEGQFRLDVRLFNARDGTSARFNTGSAITNADDLEPSTFVLSSDKKIYKPGEQVRLSGTVQIQEGYVAIAIADENILKWVHSRVTNYEFSKSVTLDRDLQKPGLFAIATAFRTGDSIGPDRQIGVVHIEIRQSEALFDIKILRPDTKGAARFVRPGEPVVFSLCLKNASGECATAVPSGTKAAAFLVDEGLLNLTGHREAAEKSEKAFLGHGNLRLRLMDNYNRLLKLKTGGDRPGRLALSNYTSNQIVSMAKGPNSFDKDGRAKFTFDGLTLNDGNLVIYAVVWDNDNIKSATMDLAVRHRLVSRLGLPEVIFAGDRLNLPFRLENISARCGTCELLLDFDGGDSFNLKLIESDGTEVPRTEDGRFEVTAKVEKPQDFVLAISVPDTVAGAHILRLNIASKSLKLHEAELNRSWALQIQSPQREATKQLSVKLPRAGLIPANVLRSVIDDQFIHESVEVKTTLSRRPVLGNLIESTSEAGPISSLDHAVWTGLTALAKSEQSTLTNSDIQSLVDTIQSFQIIDGIFVPYRTDGEFVRSELGLDGLVLSSSPEKHASDGKLLIGRAGMMRSASALQFLQLAKEGGYTVMPEVISRGNKFLLEQINYLIDSNGSADLKCSEEAHYAVTYLLNYNLDTKFEGDCLEYEGSLESGDKSWLAYQRLLKYAVDVVGGREEMLNGTGAGLKRDMLQSLVSLPINQKALAINLLHTVDPQRTFVDALLASIVERQNTLDPRDEAMLASAVWSSATKKLEIGDIKASHTAEANLSKTTDGSIETASILYTDLDRYQLKLSSPTETDIIAHMEVRGFLTNNVEHTLSANHFDYRFFDPVTGQERNIVADPLMVGDSVAVIVQISKSALDRIGQSETKPTDAGDSGAKLVRSLLPSAFVIEQTKLPLIGLPGELRDLEMKGDIRNLVSTRQEIAAVFLPDNSGPGEIGLRFGFMARAVISGSFTFPGARFEPFPGMGTPELSRTRQIEIKTAHLAQ